MQPFIRDCSAKEDEESAWSIQRDGDIVAVTYGRVAHHPQYAALHLDSGYLRMLPEPTAGWGTSIIIVPSFWEAGKYRQGAPVAVEWSVERADLVAHFSGEIHGLQVRGELRFAPPRGGRSTAAVSVEVEGNAAFDVRAGEVFKPVALSSMRVSETLWDTSQAYVEFQSYDISSDGWIPGQADTGRTFGLVGGTSVWKKRAPTVEITLDRTMQVGGWVTPSEDPNDDNVSLWAAPERPIRSWAYRIKVKP